jgi:uncharacterized membrane protein
MSTSNGREAGEHTGEREEISLLNIGAFLIGAALGSFIYRLVVEILLEIDVFEKEFAYDDAGVRDAVLQFGPWVALVAGAVAVVWAVRWTHERAPRRVIAGAALLGAGLATTVWGALDMHALALYDWEPGLPAGLLDFVYHGAGVLIAIFGYALVAAPARSPRDV